MKNTCERGNEITIGSPFEFRGITLIDFFPPISLLTKHLVRTSTV